MPAPFNRGVLSFILTSDQRDAAVPLKPGFANTCGLH